MKKSFMIWMALLLLTAALMGCAAPAAPVATPAPSESPAAEDAAPTTGITMSVKPKTVTLEMEQVTVLVANNTDKDYNMGYEQRLQKKTGDTWEDVPLTNEAATMNLLTIPAGEMMDFTFDFVNHYENLEHGTYRIVKVMTDMEGNSTEVTCEFDMF